MSKEAELIREIINILNMHEKENEKLIVTLIKLDIDEYILNNPSIIEIPDITD